MSDIAEEVVEEAIDMPQEAPENDSESPAEEQPETVSLQISPVISTVLQGMPIPVSIAGHAAGWQVVPITEDDGSKNFAAVLALSQGNGFQLYWFRDQDMQRFINNAIMVHREQLRLLDQANPLMVANKTQMDQAIAGQQAAQRLIVPGR